VVGVERRPEETGDGAGGGLEGMLRSLIVAPRMIVHGFALGAEGPTDFDAAQERGIHSAAALVDAVLDVPLPAPVELVLLTSQAVGVSGADLEHPEQAPLAAPSPDAGRSGRTEPRIGRRQVDIGASADLDQTLAAMVCVHEGPAAVRGADAWVRRHEPLDPGAPQRQSPDVRPESAVRADDTVLITGGLEGHGLELARRLARERRCRLALTGGVELPPRELRAQAADRTDEVGRRVRAVAELEAAGAEVLALTADAGDEAAMRRALRSVLERSGGLDVVVHAAGAQSPPQRPIQATAQEFRVLQSVLGEVLDEDAPCRLVVLSPAFAASDGDDDRARRTRAATAAVLEALAHAARQRGEGRWLTLSWDISDTDDAEDGAPASAATAAELFENVLAASGHLAQAMITNGLPETEEAERHAAAQVAAHGDGGGRSLRPTMAAPFVEPAEGLEHAIAEAWAQALNVAAVGADDNFFELGGRSMTAVQLAVSIGAAQRVALPATAIVEHPTVHGLARRLRDEPAAVPDAF
jgi:hypothetical protein